MQFSTPETRASLILRLQDAADMSAWDSFESIYAPVIHRVACQLGLQFADAQNVVQEVLLRVAKSLDQWIGNPDKGSFRGWLVRIARNEAVRLLTRRATKPWAAGGESNDLQLQNLATGGDLASKLDTEYQRELFLWAAERVRSEVSDKTWQAFWLTHVEGMTAGDAAKDLGVEVGHIYFGRSRVMHRLKVAVQGFEGEAP